ncbi:hypothetical protein [Actinomadura miaoliensis]
MGRGRARHEECEACGQRIIWARTLAARWQALDPEPNPDGSVLAYRDHWGEYRARSVQSAADGPRHPLERVYMPHAATCNGPHQQELPAFQDLLLDPMEGAQGGGGGPFPLPDPWQDAGDGPLPRRERDKP